MAKKNKVFSVHKVCVKADVVQMDGVEGFACYQVGSQKRGRCVIGLNVEAFMACVAAGQLESKDLPYLMAETMMHEVIHALEDWAKVEFSHRKVNALLKAYREHYYGKGDAGRRKRRK